MNDVVFRSRRQPRHHLRAVYPQGAANSLNAVKQLQAATAAARASVSGGTKASSGTERKRKRDQERATIAATSAMPQLLLVKTCAREPTFSLRRARALCLSLAHAPPQLPERDRTAQRSARSRRDGDGESSAGAPADV